ncbi:MULTISPECIES: ABC transporter ATP-binding protein [unclassified Streptomyces]|uniref:ABC transporter ATP-binding protein n=1 Tax=unclassified Streptomyces TaxID=2593676 RepID=UPI0036DFB081
MIEAQQLTKRYGDKTVVDRLSFSLKPGTVTGFLGPNGAGKSTTMRMIVGLDTPTSGSVTVNGKRYARLPAPLHEIGALIDAKALHPGRTARGHLRILAATHGISGKRVDEVLHLVGLEGVADKRAGKFSLGMGQRLGIAAALLGNPAVVMLDEPVNGLDPEGVLWVRHLLQRLAREGRTVLVSSHLMSEMALTAERLVVIGRGRLLADSSMDEFVRSAGGKGVTVVTDDADRLCGLLDFPGVSVTAGPDAGRLLVEGLGSRDIGRVAAAHDIALVELTPRGSSLEEAFMELTRDSAEYVTADMEEVTL